MVESNDGGANVSINGGETWTGQDYPTAQLYHVAIYRRATSRINNACAEREQDNTTICVSSAQAGRGGGGGARIAGLQYSAGGGESGYIAPHPVNPNIFYAGSQGALLTRLDRSTGQMRDVQVYPLFFSGMPASALKERWQWTFPIVFSPLDPNVLYTSSQHLWKTTQLEGQSWQMISPDLTRADPKNARRFRRSHHQGSERSRNLRHDFHHRALSQRPANHLDRFRRWHGLHHSRWREELEKHHAAGYSESDPHQPD